MWCKRGLSGIDLHELSTAFECLVGKRGGRINETGSTDGEENVRSAHGFGSRLHSFGRQHLAEPHHVGPERSPARRTYGWRPPLFVVLYLHGLHRAPSTVDVAVQLDHITAASPLVQAVYVLGGEGELREEPLEFRNSQVSRVRMSFRDELAPPRVPVPDEFGIAGERLRCREFLGIEARPQAGLGLSKGRNAALGGDARSGENDRLGRVTKGGDQGRRHVHQRLAGHGPEQIFGPVTNRYRSLHSRSHVPNRGNALGEFVVAEYDRVRRPNAVGLLELRPQTTPPKVEVGGDPLIAQDAGKLDRGDTGLWREGNEEHVQSGLLLLRSGGEKHPLDAGAETDASEVGPAEVRDETVVATAGPDGVLRP